MLAHAAIQFAKHREMRAKFVLICMVACGVAAGVILWRDRSPAVRPAYQRMRALIRPTGTDRAGAGARPGPRPSLVRTVEARSPRPVPIRLSEDAPGTPPSGDGDDIAVTRALVLASLVHDIPGKLPELELSAEDLGRLADAVLRVREHNVRLRALAHIPANAAEIRHLAERLVHDLLVFEEVTGMPATDFTGALSDEGVTTEEQAHATKPVYWTLSE